MASFPGHCFHLAPSFLLISIYVYIYFCRLQHKIISELHDRVIICLRSSKVIFFKAFHWANFDTDYIKYTFISLEVLLLYINVYTCKWSINVYLILSELLWAERVQKCNSCEQRSAFREVRLSLFQLTCYRVFHLSCTVQVRAHLYRRSVWEWPKWDPIPDSHAVVERPFSRS